jgi:hypothetical protein
MSVQSAQSVAGGVSDAHSCHCFEKLFILYHDGGGEQGNEWGTTI